MTAPRWGSLAGLASDRWLLPVQGILLLAAVVFPAITSWERITFDPMGIELNVRVVVYSAIAGLAGSAAAIRIVQMRIYPVWLSLMLAMLGWLLLTALAAAQSPREWLPTIVRYVLYFGSAVVFFSTARLLTGSPGIRTSASLLAAVVLAAAVVPMLAGTWQILTGSASMLNGAPRVSGSMPSHPAAYSLVLVVCAVTTMSISRSHSMGSALRWLAVTAITVMVFATYTRLSILLLIASGVALAALLPGDPRSRVARTAAAAIVGAAVILVAQPTFEARFTYPTSISHVIASGQDGASADPGSLPDDGDIASPNLGGGQARNGQPSLDFEVDNSIAFRIMLTKKGLEYLAQSPLVGHGPGSFHRLFEAETGQAQVAAHDDLMSVAVSSGIPGLILYLALFVAIGWSLWPRKPIGVPEADGVAVAALVILLAVNMGATIHNPTYFVEIQLPIWILVGAGLGYRAQEAERDDALSDLSAAG